MVPLLTDEITKQLSLATHNKISHVPFKIVVTLPPDRKLNYICIISVHVSLHSIVQAEFSGGILVCNGVVAIRRVRL